MHVLTITKETGETTVMQVKVASAPWNVFIETMDYMNKSKHMLLFTTMWRI